MREQALFVGNGPNRVVQDSHSWTSVLTGLAQEVGQPSVTTGSTGRPFTFIFEELALRYARRGGSEDQLKEIVAARMQQLSPNIVHERLMSLGVRHVLTTNYDYSLELTSGYAGHSADLHPESRYSLFRCREAGAKRVWHIHGEIAKPATLMLGYDHYVGSLHKTKNYLTTKSAKPQTTQYDYRSPVIHSRYNLDNEPHGYSWLDVFLRDDIHIVGFGCDYSEIVIWWLLGYKERLRLTDGRVPKGVTVGRTLFYYFCEDAASEPLMGTLQVLEDLGVTNVPIQRGESYAEGWDRLCEVLSRGV